jgi:hypothetical protein
MMLRRINSTSMLKRLALPIVATRKRSLDTLAAQSAASPLLSGRDRVVVQARGVSLRYVHSFRSRSTKGSWKWCAVFRINIYSY